MRKFAVNSLKMPLASGEKVGDHLGRHQGIEVGGANKSGNGTYIFKSNKYLHRVTPFHKHGSDLIVSVIALVWRLLIKEGSMMITTTFTITKNISRSCLLY